MGKPWHSKEWKEKRIDILNRRNICEKCGTTEDLCLHHPKGDFRSPEEIRNTINNEAYREFKKDYRAKQQPKKPVHTGRHRHKSHNYWHQSSVQHRYEIDESNISWEEKIPSHTQKEKDGFKAEFNLWKKKHDIKTLIENEIEKENQRYMALEGVMILCKGCHKNIHLGRELCPICKKVYKELSARTCWYCRSDDEKEKIPLTDSQKKYIESLINDFPTTEDDKEYTRCFLHKIKKESMDELYKEEAHLLINNLIAIKVSIEMPCGCFSGVSKNELNRSKHLEDAWLCYYHCPNGIYSSHECDRFPETKKDDAE